MSAYRARITADKKARAEAEKDRLERKEKSKLIFLKGLAGDYRHNSTDIRHHGLVDAKSRENVREHDAERRMILANGPEFPQGEWLERVREWGGVCLRCGTDVDLTVDHIIPVHLGGTDHIDNLQLLCRSCNSSKGTKKDDYRPPKT